MKKIIISLLLVSALFAGYESNFIFGFDVTRSSHTNITIGSAGMLSECRNAADTFDMDLNGTASASLWATGIGGVDQGYIVSNAVYYVFVVGTKNAAYAVLSTNVAKPIITNANGSDKYAGWRSLTSFKLISTNGGTNASGVQNGRYIPEFEYIANGNDAQMIYNYNHLYFSEIAGGTNTVNTAITLEAPSTTYEAKLLHSIAKSATNATDIIYFGSADNYQINSFSNPNIGVIDIPVSSSAIRYKVQAKETAVTLYLIGYKFTR